MKQLLTTRAGGLAAQTPRAVAAGAALGTVTLVSLYPLMPSSWALATAATGSAILMLLMLARR
jgi:ABC-type cobalamin transport system permease subunit